MKILLAILSCKRDLHLEELQRVSCLRGCPIDYKFFRGQSDIPGSHDSIDLDVVDDFANLPFKTQAMCRWALAQGYERIFKCDTDTYVRPERLLYREEPDYDYCGYFSYEPGPGAYASGGSGYWLSARAASVVAAAPLMVDPLDFSRNGDPSVKGEDVQIGWALRDANIFCRKSELYRLRMPGPMKSNRAVTIHDVTLPDKARRIPIAHHHWLASGGL